MIRLIHWNEKEAQVRADKLADLGYVVANEHLGNPDARLAIRSNPPSAFVIDLSRLPSQGRDVALALRERKQTRHVPLVFVDGEPEKVEGFKQQLPDAVYTTWSRIGPALKKALTHPPKNPVVPSSRLAGYSGTPLCKKLGIKPDSTLIMLDAPDGFESILTDMPANVKIARKVPKDFDLILWFTKARKSLESKIVQIANAMESVDARNRERLKSKATKTGLWIIWPKKSTGIVTDIGEKEVREIGLANRLVDYKVCAVDATWSGLKFSFRG